MSQDDQPSYNDSHRALLQAFFSKSTFTLSEAKPVLAAISSAHTGQQVLEGDITEADFVDFVNVINTAITPYDLEIRSSFAQTSARTRVWALVNNESDAITQLSTTFSADEISYVKRVIDYMFEKNNTSTREVMAVKHPDAVRLNKANGNGRASGGAASLDAETQGSSGGSITSREAEKVLRSLCDQDWFSKDKDYYTLSPRALMELRRWLVETYNEEADEDGPAVERIKTCQGCREIVTIGQRCDQRQCSARLHDPCVARMFQAQRDENCPLCHSHWSKTSFVGRKADIARSRHSNSGRAPNSHTVDEAEEEEQEEDGEGEEDDAEE